MTPTIELCWSKVLNCEDSILQKILLVYAIVLHLVNSILFPPFSCKEQAREKVVSDNISAFDMFLVAFISTCFPKLRDPRSAVGSFPVDDNDTIET